jgi:hypothetical protein
MAAKVGDVYNYPGTESEESINSKWHIHMS